MTNNSESTQQSPSILLTGATGYVGGLLLKRLESMDMGVRCLVRDPQKLAETKSTRTEIFTGDVLDVSSLTQAMLGVQTAYYLVHSMGSSADFEKQDRLAAANFAEAAKRAGLRRIVYLGGLGDEDDPKLSPHLRSRHEVGRIFRESGIETIELRASAVLGPGSLSYELIRSLTNRLPIMICPRWLATPTQPIAAADLVQYLVEAMQLPPGDSRVFEIGGSDVVTYGELILEYARQSGLRRRLISVPVLTPYLSGLWLGLVTPATAEVGRHLIEGLRNPTIVKDFSAQNAFSVHPMSTSEAMAQAIGKGS